MLAEETSAPARPRRRGRAAPDLSAPETHPEAQITIGRLTGLWRTSLDTTLDALAAARTCGHSLGFPPGELEARIHDVQAERQQVAALLDGIAHDAHVTVRHPLSAPRAAPRMLGLPNGILACLFDLDGVLTGSAQVHAAAWRDTLDAFVHERIDRSGGRVEIPFFDLRRDYYGLIHGKPRLEGIHAFLASRGIALPEGEPSDAPGTHTVHGLANRKNAAFQRRLAREPLAVLRGASRYLEAAHEAGLERVVISPSRNTAAILERAGLARLVPLCIDGRAMEEESLDRKPAPDTLLFACERIGVPPAAAAVFETLPDGVRAAKAAGIGFVVGLDRHGRDVLLEAGADVAVADLADLLDPALGE